MAKHPVRSPVGGSVWAHSVGVGQQVVAGAMLLIVEVMKTDFPIESPVKGTISWLAEVSTTVEADDLVAIVET